RSFPHAGSPGAAPVRRRSALGPRSERTRHGSPLPAPAARSRLSASALPTLALPAPEPPPSPQASSAHLGSAPGPACGPVRRPVTQLAAFLVHVYLLPALHTGRK